MRTVSPVQTRTVRPQRNRPRPGIAAVLLAPAILAACSQSGEAAHTSRIEVDTDNGTWMNIDVRPDGREIAFDLLGDIFVIPIEGGEARPLAAGPAWENLPQYSPDGRRLAFTSDRSGAQNIWTIALETGDLHQVTHETEHLPSSPSWAPDGQALAVRRQFAAKRTIGAGEIWIYPAAGGPGRVLVQRWSTQKDINEPRYSNDGRFLYYSEDLWPGAAFEYNKDPALGIYGVQRWDFAAGESELVVQRPGGAVRPTPSPDGRFLAYVTRTGASSALVLRNLGSGRERVLYDDLDRDLQAVWANHGVYPAMDWLPDGSAIVLWSGGHILRIDAADGTTARIPFHVHHAWTVTEPPLPEFSIPSDRFPVKALRWTTVSPDGERVAFQALGRIYLRELATGDLAPLTPDPAGFEFHPAFSPDGEWVVYSTWRDAGGGDVRRTSIVSGRTQVLTGEPGLYTQPAVSPDRTRVVFHRAAGDALVASPAPAGIYSVPWTGGAMTAVTENGSAPRFCADPGRLYFVRERAIPDLPPHDPEWVNHARLLVSRDLATGEETVHADAGLATELKLSPDCRWLAWVRYSEVRAARFDPGSHPSATDVSKLPVREAGGDGGAFLSWSGDGRLYWSLGPTLYAWRPESGDRPSACDLGFSAAVAKPERTLALVGARLVTMSDAGTVEDGLVVIEGDRIRYAGPRDPARLPAGADVVDLSGKTILPGFIDSHWHGLYAAHGITPQDNWTLLAGLAFGITTIFDPFADTHDVFAVAELQRAGAIVAPRIYSTGTALYGAHSDFSAQIRNLDDARREIRRRKAFGAIAAKSYLLPQRSQQQQVIAAARELDLRVVAEQNMTTPTIMAQVFDGQSSVEHNLPFEILYDDILQAWGQTEVDHTPTLTVLMGGLWPSSYWLAQTDARPRPELLRYFPPGYLENKRAQPGSPDLADHGFPDAAVQVAKLHDAGVRIVVGAHAEIIGLGYHWELWMLHDGGMTAEEVLRAGTIEAARHLGLDSDLGSLEPGKLADLVVFDANPLADLRDTLTLSRVMIGGRLLDVANLAPDRTGPR
ncbi:MAG TPA: amidohydrolase family protein [Woeseiaceae bacterium]|nr:amidohydrolase family protein [Woeseiaceae bacterium]